MPSRRAARGAAADAEAAEGPASTGRPVCFAGAAAVRGWIDGRRQRIGDGHYRIRFTPRRPGSHWSAVHIERVAVLTAEGRMTPPGLAAYAQRTEARSRRA